MKIHDPAMTFISPEAKADWDKGVNINQDPYGNAVYQYASEWATKMESAIKNGETIAQCASWTSHEADDEGITGVHVWVRGIRIVQSVDKW